jgi:hypothetical protein
MIYKFKSIKSVVDGLYRDFDSPEDLDVWDILDWSVEALQLIGASTQLLDYWVEIAITNHVHKLPSNFETINQISYGGFPLLLTSGSMGINSTASSNEAFLNTKEIDDTNFPNIKNQSSGQSESYYIKSGCIVTSFESGTIVLSYKGLQVDDEGFPMIPDNVYFDKALKAYSQMMMDRKEWRRGNLPQQVFVKSENDWYFYCKAAASAALMPNIDKVENFKNMWVRLKPSLNEHGTFSSGLNIQESKYIK